MEIWRVTKDLKLYGDLVWVKCRFPGPASVLQLSALLLLMGSLRTLNRFITVVLISLSPEFAGAFRSMSIDDRLSLIAFALLEVPDIDKEDKLFAFFRFGNPHLTALAINCTLLSQRALSRQSRRDYDGQESDQTLIDFIISAH
jgi:hypothetical protein